MTGQQSSIPLGNHWVAVGDISKDKSEFSGFLDKIIRPKTTKSQIGNCIIETYDASKHLDIILLADHGKKFYTAFPALKLNDQKSERWQLELNKIDEWEGGGEAALICSYHGASICFFDTAYFLNREKYKVGNKYDFWLGAIAYKIEKDDQEYKFTDKNGRPVNLGKGFAGFLPALKDKNKDAPEFTIRGPVLETEASEAGQFGLNRFRMVACRPPSEDDPARDEEFRVDVYGLDKAIVGQKPKKGDALFSIAWVQGKLAHGA